MTDVPQSPPLADSDVIYLVIRRLERAAELMVSRRYGRELDEHLETVAALLDWLGQCMSARADTEPGGSQS